MKKSKLSQHYICQGCKENFSNTRIPRLLPLCGHTLCESCITERLVPNQEGGVSLTCLVDQKIMDFEDRQLNNFPKNFAMLKTIEKKLSQAKTEPSQIQSVVNVVTSIEKSQKVGQSRLATEPQQSFQQMTKLAQQSESKSSIKKEQQQIKPKTKSVPVPEIKEERQDDMCLIHSRPLELVCIRDATMICSNCALFGDHRGHMLKSLADIKKDIVLKEGEFLTVIDEKEQLQSSLDQHIGQSKIDKLLLNKKQTLSKQIQQYFDRLIKKLKQHEKKLYIRLEDVMSSLSSSFEGDADKVKKGFSEFRQWQRNALNLINIMEGDDLEQKLTVLSYENLSNYIDPIDEGYRIIDDISKQKEDALNKWNGTLSRFHIDFKHAQTDKLCGLIGVDYPILEEEEILSSKSKNKSEETKEQQISKGSINRSKSPQLKKLCSNDDLLLDMEQQFINSANIPNLDFDTSMNADFPGIVELTDVSKIQTRNDSFYQPHTSPFDPRPFHVPKSPSSISRQGEKTFDARKKPKALKVPPKYQKMIQGLMTDTIDLLDLTNSELGNHDVTSILEHLKGKKVKSVKLIRCKLSDDIIPELWNSMNKVISLNLSQNTFSDRLIDSFLDNIDKMPYLKNLTLSQNKINQRSVKMKLEEAKRYDVTISL